MSTTSDDIQAAGFDTRPSMLDRTDYESWPQRFRLYCKRKKNEHLILQSIDEGPFRMGMFRKKLGVTIEGEVMFELERPRTYADLDYHEQERYKADFCAILFSLKGLPKDIYMLDASEFDAFFELNEKDAQLQTHRNTIHKLKAQISQLKANKSDVTGTLLPQPLESQNFQLRDTINKFQKENDCFQVENSKIKHHYKELYDSVKIMRATHIEKITSLLNEIKTLKTQMKGKMPVIPNENVIPKVYVCNKYAIDVEPILPSQRNNRNVQ
nr:integrase, catalytic region, zinc finger, CCHC-type, peptidase aspartic, catalytic [Tanacetum cinerariifolium]